MTTSAPAPCYRTLEQAFASDRAHRPTPPPAPPLPQLPRLQAQSLCSRHPPHPAPPPHPAESSACVKAVSTGSRTRPAPPCGGGTVGTHVKEVQRSS
ncbi:hypothetical protein AGOR_G00087670 [Albula goreensis]|uniref:Uncharacterized protein n=1 Tax=Albula goreensis TaxID=1534307 RepID=A0A8T3DPG4_9TELE|nr:hypothetical protein AGOR_G00087670 [Albula goreensis]